MDSELIYTKTAFGEEAMHQRTRVMQRNVRMVLILVDGQSSVADLSLKTGNSELTETALNELEKGGFIEPVVEQDSLWAESKRVAQEIRSAAIDKALQFVPSRAKEPSLLSEPSLSDSVSTVDSAPKSSSSLDPRLSQFSMGHFQSSELPGMKPVRVEPSGQGGRTIRGDVKVAETENTSFMKRVFGGSATKADKPVSIKPIRRGPRPAKMGWPMRLLLVLAFVAALVYLTVFFFPYQYYLPELQTALSQICGRPVSVREMRVEVYPKPGLFLGNVSIGTGAEELRIPQIEVQPEITTLLEPKRDLRDVALHGVVLSADSIVKLQSVLASTAKPGGMVGVKRIRFENTEISFGGLGLKEMEGEAKLSADGLFQSLQLRSADRGLTLVAVPLAGGVDISLEGFDWRPALGSPWRLDSVNLKGRVENGALKIGNLDLRLFGGQVQGELLLRNDGKPSLSGDLTFERIDSTKFGEALGIGQQLSGDLAGNLHFSTSADAWPAIYSAIDADGKFSIQRGSIHGIDLTEAVRRVSSTPIQGGATQFEQMTGKFKLSPTNFRFSNLNLVSGLMQSAGYVQVSKDLKISGKMDLSMRGSVSQTRVPVSIDGLLKSPELQVGTATSE